MVEILENDISCITLISRDLLDAVTVSVPNIPLELSNCWWISDKKLTTDAFSAAVSPVFSFTHYSPTIKLGIRPLLHLYSKEKYKSLKPGDKVLITVLPKPVYGTVISQNTVFCDSIITKRPFASLEIINAFLNSKEFKNILFKGE